MSANQVSKTQETYSKQQLGAPQRGKGALLGVPWDKEKDTIKVKFPAERVQHTKRNLLTKLAKVYKLLGFASPTTLSGKLPYRKACELKIACDAELPKELLKQLSLWKKGCLQAYPCPDLSRQKRRRLPTSTCTVSVTRVVEGFQPLCMLWSHSHLGSTWGL